MNSEPLIIKKRGEDGNRIITVRIREDTLAELDRLGRRKQPFQKRTDQYHSGAWREKY